MTFIIFCFIFIFQFSLKKVAHCVGQSKPGYGLSGDNVENPILKGLLLINRPFLFYLIGISTPYQSLSKALVNCWLIVGIHKKLFIPLPQKMHKAYIFDFGNVFINLDLKSIEIFFKENQIQLKDILPTLYKFEKGLITNDKFIKDFIALNNNLTREQIIKAWNKIILDFPEYRLKFIEEFCHNHTCFLLSNINELHVEYIENLLSNTFYQRFINSFEKVYYSHEIHLRKPDNEIFEYVLNNHQLKPEECFFVDDTEENILTARKMGFNIWHLIPEKDDIIELKQKFKL